MQEKRTNGATNHLHQTEEAKFTKYVVYRSSCTCLQASRAPLPRTVPLEAFLFSLPGGSCSQLRRAIVFQRKFSQPSFVLLFQVASTYGGAMRKGKQVLIYFGS